MLEQLERLLKAHYPIVYLQSFEWYRIKELIDSKLKVQNYAVSVWNVVSGLVRASRPIEDSEDPIVAMRSIYSLSLDPEESQRKEVFLLLDFHEYLSVPEIRTRLRLLSNELKYSSKHIVLLGPPAEIPMELEKEVTLLEVPLPTKDELRKAFRQLMAEINQGSKVGFSIDQEIEDKMVSAALGLTMHEADLAFSKALIETNGFNERSASFVVREKEQVIKKSKILEYFHTSESFQSIGGMDNLKRWLASRGNAFSVKAREFGLSEPKGVLLTGVPGCGKSLIAKAIASIWNMPLLRLDVGKVFEGLLGSSEQNIRKAILTAESIAPAVLWLDEIEKGLSGLQGSGATDGGTSSRVFSTLLTWMQEKTKPVFIVATANKLDSLPPELLRKGRFDEIFFVDLPSRRERKEILRIHVGKHKRSLPDSDLDFLASISNGFNGAEIEAVVKEAMYLAFEKRQKTPAADLGREEIASAIQKTIPLSMTRKTEIEAMRELARSRFVFASSDTPESLPENKAVKLTPSEIRSNRTRNFDLEE